MPADLHVHTTASDGTEPPERVVELAAAIGLDAVAITDHDTVDGVDPARRAARSLNLYVVPGIEINTGYQGREIHILGYFVDPCHSAFRAEIRRLATARARRVERIIARLQSLGLSVGMSDIVQRAPTASLGRPHVAEALVRRGIVSDLQEAFDRWIGRGCAGYVPRERFSPVQAVHLIRSGGGVPVLAHPGMGGTDHLIPELVRAGLQGLEVHHPEHGSEDVAHYAALAEKFRLVATGGSDFHGHATHARLGAVVVPLQVVDDLKLRRT